MKVSLDKVFQVSLVLKGLDGVFELVGGLVLIFINPDDIDRFVRSITQSDLSQNSNSSLTNSLLSYSHHVSKSSLIFGSIYLILHGLVKIVLVVAVLKEELWAYPWMIAFLVIFIVYQVYRILTKFSIGLSFLTVFDIFITVLTVLEYKKHKAMKDKAANA